MLPPPPPHLHHFLTFQSVLHLCHCHTDTTHTRCTPPPPPFHSLFVRQTHKTCTHFILPSCLPFSLSHTHTHAQRTHSRALTFLCSCACLSVLHREHIHSDTQNTQWQSHTLKTHWHTDPTTHTHKYTYYSLQHYVTHYTYTTQYFLNVKTKISL